MHTGLLLVFQNFEGQLPDEVCYWNNIELGEQADALGYDSLWCPEHHFDGDYSMCPDNLQVLAYLAGRTSQIQLASGAVILPWNDPLRVVEKAALMDVLAKGRFLFGMGRGLARMEYVGMRQDMNESRERFDEAAEMILRALESGVAEHAGKYYRQPRVEIHPRPLSTFAGRSYGVAMSPDSAETAARLKLRMMAFVQGDVATVHKPMVTLYRDAYRRFHGEEAPPPVFVDFGYCHPDSSTAAELGARYAANYFRSVVTHYEFAGEHFSATRGYESHGDNAKLIREAGLDATCQGFVAAQISGTPDEIVARVQARRAAIGDFDLLLAPCYGGMPFELALESVQLIGKEVIPALRRI
ncbi:MAG TPA: LLM class flavin-dependent oxidoreductase [Pseudonocardia sp.]|jgi:alkanesulfonate monooxygenase SsuD/methylene tetrahydromethanopterin reductase-like flavin-dependent oxidoreductase (luciferase family)